MATCKTCGEKAGWFRHECSSCKIIRQENEAKEKEEQRLLYEKIKAEKQARQNIIENWIADLINYTSNHILDIDEERVLLDYKKKHNISDSELTETNKNSLVMFDLYIELREYLNNKTLPYYNKSDYTGFNFMKSEAPFLSLQLPFYEEKRVTIRKARSDGYSIRIMKGLWFRQNFHNPALQSEEMILQDIGRVVLTNRHIYFKGGKKSFRHRLDKLNEITPYKNGFQIMKETMTAKPQFFGMLGNGINLGKEENPEHFKQICSIFCHIAATLAGNI